MRSGWTDGQIAEIAEKIRKYLNIPPWGKINVPLLIQMLRTDSRPQVRIEFRECDPSFLRGAAAKTEPKERVIHYRKGLWKELMGGGAAAVAVFLEEIGHVFLHPEAEVIYHSLGPDAKADNYPEYAAMEEEAEKFVFYSFAPIAEVYSETKFENLVAKYDMPLTLAKKYIRHLESTRNSIEGTTRPIPDKVVRLRSSKPKSRPVKASTTPRLADSGPAKSYGDANTATAQSMPIGVFLNEGCTACGAKTVRIIAGCKQCLCGQDDGCS